VKSFIIYTHQKHYYDEHIRVGRACSAHGRMHRKFNRKPEGKRQLGRHRRKCDDDFIIDLKEIRVEGVNWTQLASAERILSCQGLFCMELVINYMVITESDSNGTCRLGVIVD
jgi:hypothetical protein